MERDDATQLAGLKKKKTGNLHRGWGAVLLLPTSREGGGRGPTEQGCPLPLPCQTGANLNCLSSVQSQTETTDGEINF